MSSRCKGISFSEEKWLGFAHSRSDKLQLGELGSGTGNVVIGIHKDRCEVQEEVVYLCWAVKGHDFYSPE